MAKRATKKLTCTRCGTEVIKKDIFAEVCLCEKCTSELETEYVQEIADLEQRERLSESPPKRKTSFTFRVIAWLTLFAVLAGGLTTTIYVILRLRS